MPEHAAVHVTHDAAQHRFVADLDGGQAVAAYHLQGRRILFTHTEVPPEHEGRGVGGALARAALDHARAEGLEVVPQCPFITAWVKRHKEYHDLVADEWKGALAR